MKCPKCQFENPKGAKFCNECGHDLRGPIEAPPIDYSKPKSYTPKSLADKILTIRSSIEGERKLVTVLFADVANFTPMAEKLDPEEVHQIMDGCFRILMDEIHRYEGTINQFAGDGVMALFGAPVAHEDHAQRACYAALSIQKAMIEYSENVKRESGVDFKIRVGLNSGLVVVGSIGDDLRMDYTADGDTTNLASRMESMAEPETVYVTDETFKLTKGLFEFKALGEKKVKGKDKPVCVYKVLSAKDVYRPRLGQERQIYSEMVGRAIELNRLELQVLKLINGEGSVVNIIGEAGIGKSRLVAELKRRDTMKQVALLEGKAFSIGRNLSFHPIVDLLKQWVGIKQDDSESAVFNKLETAIGRICPEDVAEIFPFVATLMGIRLSGNYAQRVQGIEGEALENLIQKNVRQLLIKASGLAHLVIVIEDLHWADISSIELLESLVRLVETHKILFVNVFRPGYKETADRIVETLKQNLPDHCIKLMLQPLDEKMSETLIDNILNIRGFPHSIVDQIVQRSGGNPFFIEEVVRSFVDVGAIVAKGDAFETTEKINAMKIPNTISDVVMARIDRLEYKTRDLVRIASVIGRTFFYKILTEVAKTVEDIDNRLSYLKEIQLIRERKRMEEIEYLFKHALAQEAAYESILLQKRKELHLKVADSIERVFKERLHEFYGMLAYHYSRGEDEDKAEGYLIKASEEALKSSASSEALYYYKKAMEVYIRKYGDAVDSNKMGELEANIGFAFYNRGQYQEAVNYFDKALKSLGEKEPRLKALIFMKFIINFLIMIKYLYLPAILRKKVPSNKDSQIHKIMVSRAKALVDIDMRRFFLDSMGIGKNCFKFDITRLDNGIESLSGLSSLFAWPGISYRISTKILDYAKVNLDSGDLKHSLYYELNESLYNYLTGRWSKGYDKKVIEHGLKIGDIFTVATYLIFTGRINIELGEFAIAEEIIEKLNKIGDEFNEERAKAVFYELNAALLLKKRKIIDALRYVNDGIIFLTRIGLEMINIALLGMKCRIQVIQKSLDVVEDTISQATNLVLREEFVPPYYNSHYLMGIFSYNLSKLENSIIMNDEKNILKYKKITFESGKNAVKNCKRVASDRTEAYRLIGFYYWLVGKQKRALKWWNQSITEGVRLDARPEFSRTYMEVGKHLLKPNSKYKTLNGISAEEYLEKARIMFKEIGLQWDLEELDRQLGSN
jgi:class 3 adenylate cyclase/tetratricopeptide (TPR) repeat protein